MFTWWALGSWTPPLFHPWRRFLLRLFGAKIGRRSDVRGSSRVWLPANLELGDHALIGPGVSCYNQAAISLGDYALVSQGVHLCAGTHDIDDPEFPLIAKPIRVGSFAWVAADAFVGPGCVIGEGTVVGGASVVFGKLDDWMVYVGNPARRLRARQRIPRAIGESGFSERS
jgi:putative colanic acid biosynthesis acetyltransferase WcaF